jgi:transcriptional regulator with XRE-family HTH domain
MSHECSLVDSLEGMAGPYRVGFTVRMTMAMEHSGFAGQLRRWRALRRMSQLDVASRADTTQRHLSFLEQGRSKPGRTMVLRLAESLDLSLRERNELLLVAGYAPAFPESDLQAPSLDAVRDAIEHVLAGHQPYPAVVVRPHGILVEANPAFGILTDGAAPSLLTPPVNVLRLALHPEGLGGRVLNMPEWGRHITEGLRRHLARNPDPGLDELIIELEGYLPAFEPGPEHLGFAVPLRLNTDDGELRLITTITSFATAVDVTVAELYLEAFLPADEPTAEILRRTAA